MQLFILCFKSVIYVKPITKQYVNCLSVGEEWLALRAWMVLYRSAGALQKFGIEVQSCIFHEDE